jgi:hypothetical protein
MRHARLGCASVLSLERAFDLSGTSNSTPSLYMERVIPLAGESAVPESHFSSGTPAMGMERLWSQAVATSGNRWQMHKPRNRL